MARGGHGVAHLGLPHVLHTGDQVAHFADAQAVSGFRLGRDDPDFEKLVHGARRHHLDPLARRDLAVDDANVGDHAAVGVVDRIEDHRARRGVRVAGRRRHLAHHVVEQVGHTLARLPGDPQHVAGFAPDDVGDFGGVAIRVGGGQVDLVQHRNDGEVPVQCQVEVCKCLRLDTLGGVHQQHRALAGLQRPRHLICEVDVAGGVDQMQNKLLIAGAVVHCPRQPHVLRLDRDAAFAFDVHPVQVLRTHRAFVDHAGQIEHPVRQRRLAVVDVGDDAEVPNLRRRGERLVGEAADGNLLVKDAYGLPPRVSRRTPRS